jgi:TetR/AcrR family fatty acid metabolism transcriptional regulator
MRGRKKSQKTQTAIVQCAAEIFSQREFHEVLTDDIARRLGIGKGTIYRYFKSKEELYLAAITEGLNGLYAAVTTVLQQDAPLETTIEAVVRTMIAYFWRQRDFFVLVHRIEPKLKAQERADWQNRRNEVVNMVRRVLEQALARGEIGPLDTRLAVEVLFSMIRAACLYRSESDRPEELTRQVTSFFLRGLIGGARPPAERARPLKMVGGEMAKGGTQRS